MILTPYNIIIFTNSNVVFLLVGILIYTYPLICVLLDLFFDLIVLCCHALKRKRFPFLDGQGVYILSGARGLGRN